MHFNIRSVVSVLILGWIALPTAFAQTTFTVTNTNDSGAGSLRQAILDANDASGADSIHFNISGDGPHTIQPQSRLPRFTDSVVIDGGTQPGASCDNWPATLQVEIDGSAQSGPGLDVFTSGVTIRGLVINRAETEGIRISGFVNNGDNVEVDGTTIECNYLGTDVAGANDRGNDGAGILVFVATNTRIGGAAPGQRNLLSGNGDDGVDVRPGSEDVVVQGNYIGTTVDGTAALPNGESGIQFGGGSGHVAGGTDHDPDVCNRACNLVSGNEGEGVRISGNAFTDDPVTDVVIQGNFIGTDITGTADLGNGSEGVSLLAAANTRVGGAEPGAGNLISGNDEEGIDVIGTVSTGNVVEGNWIGIDVTGTAALPNLADGVTIRDAADNTIGGATAEAGNVISGNGNDGIEVRGAEATGNVMQNNYVGTDAAGSAALGNGSDGIDLQESAFSVIADNLLSGNDGSGIDIEGGSDHLITGNLIGVDATGAFALGNDVDGLFVGGSADNQIGGTATDMGNTISGNGLIGIEIEGSLARRNTVAGNRIGTDASGTAALGNAEDGVLIDGAPDNTIGGATEAAGNLISGNGDDGIDVFGSGATGTLIRHNRIGVDVSGIGALGNDEDGIDLNESAAATAVRDNVISANTEFGVIIQDDATGSVLERNFIGTDADTTEELGNGLGGVRVENSGPATIGSSLTGDGNVIAFNDGPGVSVLLSSTASHRKSILGNTIYANAGLGIDLGGNGLTPNDTGDADDGPNRLQNFPEIVEDGDYDADANQISLTYRVDSDPANSAYPIRVEFFRADADLEEGKTLLGSDTYTESDFTGGPDKPLQFTPAVSVTGSDYIVATATDDAGNTSEFSGTARQLPVELASFEAMLEGNAARLTWQTASETSNAGFHVERSVGPDGSFQQIGFVEGTGTTTEVQHYRFADRQLPFTARALTYRLRQVDTDGTATLSEEAILEVRAPENVVLHGVFPHPVQALATLRYELAKTGAVRIELYDLLGRRVRTLIDGDRPAGRHESTVDASSLPSGVYFYRLTAGNQVQTERLVVQR